MKPISDKRLSKLTDPKKVRRGTFILDTDKERAKAKERRKALAKKLIDNAVKETKAAAKPKRHGNRKSSDRAYWRKQADKWFSEWIRLRDCGPDGMCQCTTHPTPKLFHWRDLQCGHWQKRGKDSTRYDERNCHAQCAWCNKWQDGRPAEHETYIKVRYGTTIAALIRERSGMKGTRKWHDYQRIAEEYKSKVDRIKEEEPEKYDRK